MVEYCGSYLEYESDGSTEHPSSSTSEPERDRDDCNGLSAVHSVTGELVNDGDDMNFSTDTWKNIELDNAADELLDHYTFNPPGVSGSPESKPEEYVDTNLYARRKPASKQFADPDKIHRPLVDVMLKEIKTFLGLIVNLSLTKGVI